MKTLTEHTILYDDECPLCSQYTKAFVSVGMLDDKGRASYTAAINNTIPNLDVNKARNEIALVNKKDNSVMYGVDSLLHIIGNSMPQFKPLFKLQVFRFLASKLYFFIAFNRKVIVPAKVFEGKNACTPDLNYTYRCLYIITSWLITSLVLVSYSKLIIPLIPASNFYREFMVCGGQIIFQGIVVAVVRRDRLIHYLGNMMTISLGGAILLTPMLLFHGLIDSGLFYAFYFMLVAGLMFLEHIRRVKLLELPWFISGTWVLYRLLVLFIIL